MKKMFFLGLVLAQLAGMAADKNAELLCVWNYKTHYASPAHGDLPSRVVYTEGTSYFFFSDNTFIKADSHLGYAELMKLKGDAGRWMTLDNNLVMFTNDGRQVMNVVSKTNSPVADLLKGEKEIERTISISSGTVPQVYAETIAFFPQH